MTTEKTAAPNSRFAKAGVSCFYDNEVLNLSFVHLMKFSAENPRPSGSCGTSGCEKTSFLIKLPDFNSNNYPYKSI
jgi:hypothetical protein